MADGIPIAELVERLTPKKRGKGRLAPAKPREGIGPSAGVAYPAADQNSLDDTGAISSPLTETARTYYTTAQTITSSNGFFVLEYYPVESSTFDDAESREVVVNYLEE